MIDIETLGTKPSAIILSIGAVMFDIKTGEAGDKLHIGCLAFDQSRDGDESTVDWWLDIKQKPARDELCALIKNNPFNLDRALEKLSKFITKYKPKNVWGNSPSFDLATLANAYQQYDMQPPWAFFSERDCRTIVNICRDITGIDPKQQTKLDGNAHNALNDAIYQARYVSQAFNLINKHSHTA